MDTSKHGPATGGAAPGPIADDLPWPPWLENLSDEERITAIVRAVAACAAGHTGPHDDGLSAQHCTVVMAEHFLAKLLPGVSLGEQPHDPAHCDRDGQPHLGPCDDPVTDPATAARPLTSVHDRVLALADRWSTESRELREQSIRDGLHPALAGAHREANLIGYFAAQLRAEVELDAGDPGPAGEPASTPALLSLAAALERRADRIGDHGLTRDGSIRARVLREAAGMARRAAVAGQETPGAPGPVPVGTGDGQDGTDDPGAAQDDDSDLTEDGWPL